MKLKKKKNSEKSGTVLHFCKSLVPDFFIEDRFSYLFPHSTLQYVFWLKKIWPHRFVAGERKSI